MYTCFSSPKKEIPTTRYEKVQFSDSYEQIGTVHIG